MTGGETRVPPRAIQDAYPAPVAHCYGCGRLNPHGLQLKSYWVGDETSAVFRPRSYHTAMPGYVYGGLLASLIDCHGTGTAAAAASRDAGLDPERDPPLRFVTAALRVDYLKPTPIDVDLRLRGRVKERMGRRVTVEVTVEAHGEVTARGEVVAVQMPEAMGRAGA
ncbi:MAG: PaaI family thioesterase [Armatimonadota bacterium]|nr:PaaI family thioesterase [Armatimonadota bacterium]MDR7537502.1 PaaI family thioesterase [Armatimonadota bacterium]